MKEALKIIEFSQNINAQFENLSLTLRLYRNKNTKNEKKINQIVNHSSNTNNNDHQLCVTPAATEYALSTRSHDPSPML